MLGKAQVRACLSARCPACGLPERQMSVTTDRPGLHASLEAAVGIGRCEQWRPRRCSPASRCPGHRPGVRGRGPQGDLLRWSPRARARRGPPSRRRMGSGARSASSPTAGRPDLAERPDLIDVFAASRHWTNTALEEFDRRHACGRFKREDLQASLTAPSGPMTPPSPPSEPGPWSGQKTSRLTFSKRPIIRTSTDRLWVRPDPQAIATRAQVSRKATGRPGHADGRLDVARCHARSAMHWRSSGSRRSSVPSRSNTWRASRQVTIHRASSSSTSP